MNENENDYVFPETRYFSSDEFLPNGAFVGKGSMICPKVRVGKNAYIGKSTFVDSGCTINGRLGDHVKVFPNAVVEITGTVGNDAEIFPFCVIEGNVGNRCLIGDGTRILKDTTIPDGENVGMHQTR
jgi:UDP-3-O-[3-hydroxymyristoyl] glucosamine N-acyltransferase